MAIFVRKHKDSYFCCQCIEIWLTQHAMRDITIIDKLKN